MGYSHWSNQAYTSRQAHRSATNQTAFTHDQQVREGLASGLHPQMDIAGKIRESRDSVEHPESLAIAVIFDVTGSMGSVPRVLQTKLGALMRLLIQKGYVAHPQVLFGAVGDAYTDSVPLQIGQFESGLEMDDELGKFYLEGGGGGQVHETYELGIYAMAYHTSVDCFEKRAKKGYLFTIGDEKPYDVVRASHARDLLGDALEKDIPLETVIAATLAKFEYFHIIPTNTYHGKDADVQKRWRDLLGERVLLLADENAVCETIGLAIGLCEGSVDDLYSGAADLRQAGYNANSITSAAQALGNFASQHASIVPVAKGTLPPVSGTGNDGRL